MLLDAAGCARQRVRRFPPRQDRPLENGSAAAFIRASHKADDNDFSRRTCRPPAGGFQEVVDNSYSECTITHMKSTPVKLSTSDIRRGTVVSSAVAMFAQSGYLGTSVAAVAEHAGISTAYVFKLFPSKELLFVTALEHCFELVQAALERGAAASGDQTPEGILSAMGETYAELIGDRSLLMLQVHAQSSASVPEIVAALRKQMALIIMNANIFLSVSSKYRNHRLKIASFDKNPENNGKPINAIEQIK